MLRATRRQLTESYVLKYRAETSSTSTLTPTGPEPPLDAGSFVDAESEKHFADAYRYREALLDTASAAAAGLLQVPPLKLGAQ